MDVKIASRLYDLRRKKGMSQEDLADALGVTRQAVSKWERAESSPDTDNLIALARLYGVSLDELVGINGANESEFSEDTKKDGINFRINDEDSHIDIKLGDIDISSGKSRVKIDRDGIFIDDNDGNSRVVLDKDGVFVNGNKKVNIDKGSVYINNKHVAGKNFFSSSLISLLSVIAYILMGALADLWHPGWLVFFLVPIIGGLESAIRMRNPHIFPYPVFCAALYLTLGFVWGLWHPYWVIFITIPVYYTIVSAFRKSSKER